jgi:multiple sugar transport system permease protein
MLQTARSCRCSARRSCSPAGGPSGASRPIVLYIFEVAFGRWELGYAAAIAEILFAMILASPCCNTG